MSNFYFNEVGDHKPELDHLKIDFSSGKVTGTLGVFTFLDKDTEQWVAYMPAIDLTGYGPSAKNAVDMLRFSVQNFFEVLIQKDKTEITNELADLGFTRHMFFNKRFSRAFVDAEGVLRDFNVDINSVTVSSLTAA